MIKRNDSPGKWFHSKLEEFKDDLVYITEGVVLEFNEKIVEKMDEIFIVNKTTVKCVTKECAHNKKNGRSKYGICQKGEIQINERLSFETGMMCMAFSYKGGIK